MTADPLEIALGAQRPIPADRQEQEIDLLVPAYQRRITIADHARWQQTGRPPHEDDADLEGMIQELRQFNPNQVKP